MFCPLDLIKGQGGEKSENIGKSLTGRWTQDSKLNNDGSEDRIEVIKRDNLDESTDGRFC